MTDGSIRIGLLVAVAALSFVTAGRPVVVWNRTQGVCKGAYARVHRLQDGRFMCAYERGGNVCPGADSCASTAVSVCAAVSGVA